MASVKMKGAGPTLTQIKAVLSYSFGEANASKIIAAVNERDALREALAEATAALAVIANHAGATHPGLADADNLASVRGFANEAFLLARAALAEKVAR